MKFELPKLNYQFSDLEPYIDAQTVEIHYSKHHQAYTTNLNTALESQANLDGKSVEELLKDLDSVPEEIRTTVRNNGGGYYNHNMYWQIMSKNPKTAPEGTLKEAIDKTFGSLDNFKSQFTTAAMTRFGSGWAWLVIDGHNLEIMSTSNQDSPVSVGKKPVLGLDVWEHAYYLKYQNRRKDYIDNWWNVLDWAEVEKFFK